VNGTRDAKLEVDRALYRSRVLSGANARVMRLALTNGLHFAIIGNDGGLLASPLTASEIWLGPGERLDLVVDLRGQAPGTKVMLR
jgi:FtsP/CotA-like multicopper oxidase with cupredoxin domain